LINKYNNLKNKLHKRKRTPFLKISSIIDDVVESKEEWLICRFSGIAARKKGEW